MKNIKFTLYDIVYKDDKTGNVWTIRDWLTDREYAGLKRRKDWKHRVSIKKEGSVNIHLKL